jgi:hypothetical protein
MSDDEAWLREDRDHTYRMEQEKTSQVMYKAENRKEAIQVAIATVGIVTVVVAVIWALWSADIRNQERKQQQILVCTQSGGTMLELKSGKASCVYLRDSGPVDGS